MSYIKHSLPDDWEPASQSYFPKKYVCIGNKEIESKWLPRWYDVPFEECLFERTLHIDNLIILTYRPDGDYKEHLKILKTEKLLNGI
tara:strand:+ start:140 stop:400 length:261 start_codon:yes stop_codon:yes gene_type:complete